VTSLRTWDATDEGLPVRWINSGPFLGWADERNWSNRAIRDDFVNHLQRVIPDVVHFHSLQGLGALLLPAAKEAGAAVVVTMHDFWWLCPRQFLVDRDFQPCCLVADAGACPCEVDSEWRRERRAALADLLRHADLVLAPSASAAAVLVANGVAPGRLEVDENGIDPPVLPALERGASRAERILLYAGGAHPMKGVDVLLEAARRLERVPGWRLLAYGAQEFLDESGMDLGGAPVEVRPSYDPDRLGEVLAEADVLVLPSVMRETYSLLTREALGMGLVVLTSDCIGPEEVVRDGVNGLVVPSGDVAALTRAIEQLVTDDALFARLASGAASVTLVPRSLDAQLDGLEHRYRTIVRRPAGAVPMGRVRSVVFAVGIEGAPLRYRARLPAEALGLIGVTTGVYHYRDDRLPGAVADADALVVYRVPATTQVGALIEEARSRGMPVLFDVDDLIFDPELANEIPALALLPPDEAALWLEGVRRYRTTMEWCDGYVGSTQLLVDHAAAMTGLPTARFDNGVGVLLGRQSDLELRRARRAGRLRIGYFSGTTTHDHDLLYLAPALATLLRRHRDVELWLGGHLPLVPELQPFGRRVVRLPFVSWLELPAVLRDLDVNLAPLAPGSRFNEAKSAIKWLEAALVATPTIASQTGPFVEAIEHGRNGMLAASPEEFGAALERLVRDPVYRRSLGMRARRDALLRWSPYLQGERYQAVLERSFEWAGAHRQSSWESVVHDEPFTSVALEPYDDLDPTSGQPRPYSLPRLRRAQVVREKITGPQTWRSTVFH
jgi:glycosyltransferase involved in cell wall biosynthesis